jgi:hypothetical protein
VSNAKAIAKLESLLERVRMRAGVRAGSGPAAAAPVAHDDDDADTVEAPVQMSTWTPPPPDREPDAALAVDVDFTETTQTDAVAARLDSTERLVVVESATGYSSTRQELPSTDEEVDDLRAPSAEADDDDLTADATQLRTDDVGEPNTDDGEEQAAEPAPASSRRPVMPEPGERLDQMAFGSGEAPPPLHTPPPESGRVPAAPADDFDSEAPEAEDAAQPDEPLVAEATRAQLDSSVHVAKVVGMKARPTPTTFLAALEETLSL